MPKQKRWLRTGPTALELLPVCAVLCVCVCVCVCVCFMHVCVFFQSHKTLTILSSHQSVSGLPIATFLYSTITSIEVMNGYVQLVISDILPGVYYFETSDVSCSDFILGGVFVVVVFVVNHLFPSTGGSPPQYHQLQHRQQHHQRRHAVFEQKILIFLFCFFGHLNFSLQDREAAAKRRISCPSAQ